MTRKKNKKIKDINMNSNPEYGNNGEDPFQSSNFNSHNQNTTGRTINSYDGSQQKRSGNDFKNKDKVSKHLETPSNKGRGQNTNYVTEFGRSSNTSHSKNSYYNKSGEQNNIDKEYERGYAVQYSNDSSKHLQQIHHQRPFNKDLKNNEPSSNYLSSYNDEAIGQNINVTNAEKDFISQSKDNNDYFNKGEKQKGDNFKISPFAFNYEIYRQIDSTNFQKDTNSRKPLKVNLAVKKGENGNYGEVSLKDRDNGAEYVQSSRVNVEYMSQKMFLENYIAENSSESMDSEIKNHGNLPGPKKPVPFPRTSVSKSEDEDGKGARKKQKSNNDNQFYGGYCMTCEKFLVLNEFHKDHKVLPIEKAITVLKEQDQSKIVAVIEEVNSQLAEEMQTEGIINLCEKSINSCLLNVFKGLKTTSNLNIDQLNQIRDTGVQIMDSTSIDNITNMMSWINFRNESQNIITMNQKLLSDLKHNSCWLIFSWFKMSIGLIIQSGVKVFTEIESKMSIPSYASFDLSGDRLRLFSFKTNITPERGSVILPFESVRALFRNEDSKSFMIIGSSDQEGGQVVIRINKEVFWGQQFISLCLGESGPSLRNTSFFRSCGRGKPYHHVWGGDYSQNDGSGGEAFLPWDEPLKQSPEFIVKGLVAGRYGHSDKSSIFRIYVKGAEQTQKPTKENFCFGHVEEGMETLEFFASQSDITKATIKDAGCFLVLK